MASSRITVRVLIANQQPIVRHGLWDVIASEPDLHVVGETDDGWEAVRLASYFAHARSIQNGRPNLALHEH
jgi:DNA-binding NarL/FixJ family response regulator